MARVLRMPGVAANATEAVLSEWLVEEAADFAAEEAIATVETEKAAVEVEAVSPGRVLKMLVPPGAQVEVGDPIAVLGEPGEQVDDLDALLTSLGVAVAGEVVVPERRDVPEAPAPAVPSGSSGPSGAPTPTSNGRVFSSPLARKIAKDNGLAIDDLTGTGPRGRILRRDVEAALARASGSGGFETPVERAPQPPGEAALARASGSGGFETPVERAPQPPGARVTQPPEEAASKAAPRPPEAAGAAAYEEIPHSRIRLATARRLTESKQQAPHFYVRATVHAEALLGLRADVNEDGATRVSVNDLVVKAVAAAHARVPEMNVTWTPDTVRRYDTVDIAVAVATDRGLITPVVRDVGSLTVRSVAASVRDLADRARDGRLRQDELEGGSIAVTNLGMYGVEEFAAIINPPQAAILAVGAVRDEPVVEDGAVVPGQVMRLTLSVDHRPVDGVLAARWLAILVDLLEHPVRALA
ncbi:MAG: 2-oxo acid dehydrogenase subunit E2 [Nocardioides sp.]|nr:2-oxo acid dehydrogenase subunit E2 [Nocardioides sp.]